MHSSLLESVFARVKESPKFIPLLVYLHPPPVDRPTDSQADILVNLLIDHYPEDLIEDVFEAVAMNPDRVIPMIPLILERITTLEAAPKPQSPHGAPLQSSLATPLSAHDRASNGASYENPFLPSTGFRMGGWIGGPVRDSLTRPLPPGRGPWSGDRW